MKRFLKFYQADKQHIKMINQSNKGFELVILSDSMLNDVLEVINTCEEQGDDIAIVWQMKHKHNNYILYRNCKFSTPMDNFFTPKRNKPFWGQVNGFSTYCVANTESPKELGKKIKVTCSGADYYSESSIYKDQNIKHTQDKYKDVTILNRMLKIGELNLIRVTEDDTKAGKKEKRYKFTVSEHMGQTFFELK